MSINQSNSKKYQIFVCSPIYNSEEFIEEGLKSLSSQTYENWQSFIVDNNSQDKTAAIVAKFIKNDQRFHFQKNKENIGMVGNWNAVLSMIKDNVRSEKNQLVAFLHADDYFDHRFLEKMVDYFSENLDIGLAFSDNFEINERGEQTSINRMFPINKIFESESFAQEIYNKGGNFIRFPSVVIRREVFDKLGGFDEKLTLASDFELWLRISFNYKIGYISEPLIYYRTHSTNESWGFLFEGKELKEIEQAIRISLSKYPALSENEKVSKILWGVIDRRVLNWRYLLSTLNRGGQKAYCDTVQEYCNYRLRNTTKVPKVSNVKLILLKTIGSIFRIIPGSATIVVIVIHNVKKVKQMFK